MERSGLWRLERPEKPTEEGVRTEAASEGYDCELRLRKADGSYSWMRFVGEPRFEEGKVTGFVGSSGGMEVAKCFQQMPQTKNTVLIAFTGYGQPDDIERSKRAEFAHHLVKPADPATIHKLIETMIAGREQAPAK